MINQQQCLFETCSNLIDMEKWQELVDMLAELYGASTGAIVQLRQNEFNVVVSSSNEDNFLPVHSTWPWEMKSFCRHIMETRQDLYVECAVQNPDWKYAPAVEKGPVRSYCGAPITWPNGELFGTICVIDTKETHYKLALSQLLVQLARLIASDLQTACRLQEAESLALTDELTQLHNRRGYIVLGEQKLKDVSLYGKDVGLLYLDIDNLKQVNDKHGHQWGDVSITTMADVLKELCHPTDLVARMGGDEFVVLTLVSDQIALEEFATRLTQRYCELIEPIEQLQLTSVSIGSHFAPHAQNTDLNELTTAADEAMYRTKKQCKQSLKESRLST